MKKSRGDPAKKNNEGAILICDEPVVGAFPGLLEDLGNAFFIVFRCANDGEIIGCGVAHGDGSALVGEIVIDTTG